MPDCSEFNEDAISLTPVWATLQSLPLECCHPNALEKIGSRLGTPIAMDSLTMKMERISYARILVEVDASKPLVDQVDFMLPNGVMRSQPVVYKFTPKFCKKCNRFGHLERSCQDALLLLPVQQSLLFQPQKNIPLALKKGQPTEWTVVKQKQQKQQHAVGSAGTADRQGRTGTVGTNGRQGCARSVRCIDQQGSQGTASTVSRQGYSGPDGDIQGPAEFDCGSTETECTKSRIWDAIADRLIELFR
ncbi:hypothetical protein Sango_2423900 [Sesamum angolense]|uniref:CCHC-type domain-containing protein n=1 Tax=Sesamum angolense TaxID=2727404 RepID=A0AAE2BJY8_9LAMI|nr:hypothetical protein Sango_2423900 [Sesamum angolense]